MPLRASLLGASNRHASHPVGALLNYAYTALESTVRVTAHALGVDLSIGYLHTPNRRHEALLFDLIEPLRPIVDRVHP